MTQPDESLHVVFGATGAIGCAVVGELVRAARSVRAVSRSGRAPKGAGPTWRSPVSHNSVSRRRSTRLPQPDRYCCPTAVLP